MMDYAALKNLLTTYNAELTGLSDSEIADYLNTPSIPSRRLLPIPETYRRAYDAGILPKLYAAKKAGSLEAEKVLEILDLVKDRIETIDMDNITTNGLLQNCVPSVLIQDDVDLINSWANILISIAEENNLPLLTHNDIPIARKL